MSNIEDLVKDILLNEISNDLAKKIAKALEINEHLTSTYELSVNVEDILSTDRNADPSNSGFYVKLEGITKVLLTKGYKDRTFDSVEDALVTAMEMQEDMFGWYDPTIEEYDDILFSLSYLRDRKR